MRNALLYAIYYIPFCIAVATSTEVEEGLLKIGVGLTFSMVVTILMKRKRYV